MYGKSDENKKKLKEMKEEVEKKVQRKKFSFLSFFSIDVSGSFPLPQ